MPYAQKTLYPKMYLFLQNGFRGGGVILNALTPIESCFIVNYKRRIMVQAAVFISILYKMAAHQSQSRLYNFLLTDSDCHFKHGSISQFGGGGGSLGRHVYRFAFCCLIIVGIADIFNCWYI